VQKASAALFEPDETVLGECGNGFFVGRIVAVEERAERGGAPLAEGAFEPALLAEWFEAAAAGRTPFGERALSAARHARDADSRSEVHQRQRTRVVELRACTLEHSAHVDVDREHGPTEREAGDRVRGVAASQAR
jgi:hypothetical protein